MAENWADLTAMEGQEDVIDPEPPIEADANGEIIDDTLRTRRNRAPTLNEDNIDDGNTDEAPKPKRGRGRPKKDEDPGKENYNVNQMRKELDELKSENTRLEDLLRTFTSRNEDIERDLELTRASLAEKEQDYHDLLDQFSSHEENSVTSQSNKPMGIVFHDEITEQITTKLPSSIKWIKIKKNLSDIDDSDGVQEADIVLLLTGACEITRGGVSAFLLHQNLKQKLSKIGEHCPVYATSLPPNNLARVQTDLFNHKLANMSGDGQRINLINIKFLGAKLDLVNFDGYTPNAKCIALFEKALQAISPPTSIKEKETKSKSSTHEEFNVTAVVPVKSELVGRIIGKGGSVIRRIIEECQVKISFGNWKERTSEAREEDPECFTGVMLKGQVSNVKRAIDRINEIIKSGRAK